MDSIDRDHADVNPAAPADDDRAWWSGETRDEEWGPDDRVGLGPDPADDGHWDEITDAEWDALADEAHAARTLESCLRHF